MNLTNERDDWNIDSILSSLRGRIQNIDQLNQSLTDAIENVVEHEATFKSRERVTRFIRSTKHSDAISHKSMIMNSLQNTAENSMTEKMLLLVI